jgi:hypothetical protein
MHYSTVVPVKELVERYKELGAATDYPTFYKWIAFIIVDNL